MFIRLKVTLIHSEFLLEKVHHGIIFLETNRSAVKSITMSVSVFLLSSQDQREQKEFKEIHFSKAPI